MKKNDDSPPSNDPSKLGDYEVICYNDDGRVAGRLIVAQVSRNDAESAALIYFNSNPIFASFAISDPK